MAQDSIKQKKEQLRVGFALLASFPPSHLGLHRVVIVALLDARPTKESNAAARAAAEDTLLLTTRVWHVLSAGTKTSEIRQHASNVKWPR